MANKMLIDASHPEETRVVVLRGNKVQEFDFEAADKKPLRGNIYLAKVTRVEPSLQAAFVDYGGNRHGFLAFAEIHPDYYQIPVADRIALLEEESRAHRQAEEEEPRPQPQGRLRRSRRRHSESAEKRSAREDGVMVGSAPDAENFDRFELQAGAEPESSDAPEAIAELLPLETAGEGFEGFASGDAIESDAVSIEAPTAGEPAFAASPSPETAEAEAPGESEVESDQDEGEQIPGAEPLISIDPSGFGTVEVSSSEEIEFAAVEHDHEIKARRQDERDEELERSREESRERPSHDDEHHDDHDHDHDDEADHVEHIGGDAMEELPFRTPRTRKQYKIQEVIKRRQVLLVQVVKEERGNKGAALTTYLSLAGRFSVLMPNTARGGGISRKITDGADRKRLKEIVQELEVPEGMGVILRTAGATRTKAEVKRDFEYLLRMWENVRELTLRSTAPTLVYEEGSLIKRAIRDLYGRDVDEVIVSGEESYREARDFMRMLMPSHAKNVKLHRESAPIFAESGVEAQLDAMFSNQVTLKSGGYLVINQTEALVAIDVNSGRSTREHNIEDTALRTNLEAADEIARQLRLRDLAGLIVVDFIDMEESRNNRSVERRIKDALKNDRARIQVGRISHFGLLEMSRQRIRAGVVEGSTVPCPHCSGSGAVRSTASIALHVLRVLEEALVRSSAHNITLRTRAAVALYILNQKRNHLQDLEQRFGVHITVGADDTLTGSTYHALERGELASGVRTPPPQHLRLDSISPEVLEEEAIEEERPIVEAEEAAGPVQEKVRESGRGAGRFPRQVARQEGGEVEETGAEPPVEGEEEGEGFQRSRRRRRRRGRGGGNGAINELAQPGAEQPSDDALAFMANIEGTPAPEEGRRAEPRVRRGPGRWMRSTPLAPEFKEPATFPVDEGEQLSENFVSPTEAHMPPFAEAASEAPALPPASETPAVEAPVSAQAEPTAPESVAPVETPPVPAVAAEAPAAAETVEAAPEAPATVVEEVTPRPSTEVVITKADPGQPKKGGWWQRAKASLGGGD
ncbi:Rne/Rng family ribonuclease [Methylocystis heyeri]|uniref:Ribonuclease E n=1 Tax=Methylocystis heyeri TaxID=391905 RepID=A0A6B8K9C9_9HYPH|nr:Rne/Rng family ribonuclease [Methylocystis heyeri]QGM44696.1 Rne/Rng family ribonuclease [Methylocystis heyeri]